MTEKLSPRVESLFHEALEQSEDQREEFLVRACAGNASLYDEVKSLLQSYSVHQQFFEEMAVPRLVLEPPAPAFKTGAVLGSHEIIRLLGKGGMGEVYLARHLKLGRKDALKILPQNLSKSPDLIERLYREAKTASALNHPNILTIHDFGEEGPIRYIVSEFVEGTQLREHIGQLSIGQAFDYARQIGQALQAAHQVGIVHRDIKPENIMVRSDGYIKVVDFGLAKLADPTLATGESLAARLSTSNVSMPGVLIGTINYMSPEQARGQQVDLRTDIWSWGVVLYEMLSARRPFDAATPSDVLAAILNKAADPPTGDESLNRLVNKALSKELDQRYPTMEAALEELAQIHAGSSISEISSRALSQPTASSSRRRPALRFRRIAWFAASVLFLALAATAGYRWWEANRPFRTGNIKPLITGRNVRQQAISPDGKYLAYSAQEGIGQSLRVLQTDLRSDNDNELLEAQPGQYIGITFSKDSKHIYYVFEKSEPRLLGKLYRIPLLVATTRTPKFEAEDIDSRISFSPDGNSYVFLRFDPDNHKSTLIERRLGSSSEAQLATVTLDENAWWTPPAWSPLGDQVLFAVFSHSPPAINFTSVHLPDRMTRSFSKEWSWVSSAAWLKNGRSIAVAATPLGSARAQLFEVSLPGGDISRISSDPVDYLNLDSTADSQSLTAIQFTRLGSMWIVARNGTDVPHDLRAMGNRVYSAAWMDSESLITQAEVNGRQDLWNVQLGGSPEPLTEERYIKKNPAVSRDGHYVVYTCDRDGAFHLWRIDAAGGNPVRLTSDSSLEDDAAITPDGKWVIYTGSHGGTPAIMKVSIDSGKPSRIGRMEARRPALSPDGQWIAFEKGDQGGWTVAVMHADGESSVQPFPQIPAGEDAPVRWSADGKNLLYVVTKNDVSNVWEQPLHGGAAQQLTHFEQNVIFAFAPSPDGRYLACARGTKTSDVVLIPNAR